MKISPKLTKFILDHSNEIDNYQFENIYSKLESEFPSYSGYVCEFTTVMLSVDIDPAEYLGYIPAKYLERSGLKTYNIPNSVTSIGDDAFEYCYRLTSIAIPNSVISIKNSAFYGCSGLTSISIPDSVTSIGTAAFYNCSGLTSVTIGTGVASIGKYAFDHCYELKDVNYNGTVKQWKNIKICKEAFPSTLPIIHCTDGEA